MSDVMRLKPADRKRRGVLIGMQPERKTELAKLRNAKPHPNLKRWRWPEKPIEIIG